MPYMSMRVRLYDSPMTNDLPDNADDGPNYDPDRPSKSQVKRDLHALLDLGRELVELSPERLKQLPLAERLYDAIRLAQRTPSREGLRRQIHYVGKLVRDAPADEIRAKLDEWKNGSRKQTAALHHLEARRDKLLRDDDALTELLAEYPQADSQQLRTMIREGRKELAANAALRPGQEPLRKHYRALFQALRQLQDPDEQP